MEGVVSIVSDNLKYCPKCREEHLIEWFDGKHKQNCKRWNWAERIVKGAINRNLRQNEIRIDNGEEPISFTITSRDIINQWDKQNGLCVYTKYPLGFPWLGPHPYGKQYEPELDRIENELGYIKENIAFSTKMINAKKKDLSFIDFFDKVSEEFAMLYDVVENIINMVKNQQLKVDGDTVRVVKEIEIRLEE